MQIVWNRRKFYIVHWKGVQLPHFFVHLMQERNEFSSWISHNLLSSTFLASSSEITHNDNSSIFCFSDFVLDARLLLPLYFAFGVFTVDYQNFCIQPQLFLRHYPQLRFPKHLIPKKNQEKRNLYQKILRMTSPVCKQYSKKILLV